ncbi:MAG: hypothetical protein RL326_924 [Pseudomonadota bacterium]
MYSNQLNTQVQSTKYPAEVHPLVSELFHTERSSAETQIWRDLQHKEGAVWHRQADPQLLAISERLAQKSNELRHWQDGYSRVREEVELARALRHTVGESPLVARGIIPPDQAAHLEEQYRAMYKFLSLLTGDPTVVIDLRIEREGGFIENFHRDFGTALLMTVHGPGPHFIQPDNVPSEHEGVFFRDQLPRVNELFEVPTLSLLAMRGKPNDSDVASGRGLWHSSPSKVWNGAVQWDCRVLLIATSPTSTIIPPPPTGQF